MVDLSPLLGALFLSSAALTGADARASAPAQTEKSPSAAADRRSSASAEIVLDYPVVLVHGFAGFKQLGPFRYFNGIADHLAQTGRARCFTPALPPYNSTRVRAQVLARFVETLLADTDAAKVHIIGHSQGGIDARYLISELGFADRVATLTTIASPHHGTVLAEMILAFPEDSLDPPAALFAWFIHLLDDPAVQRQESGDTVPWPTDMEGAGETMSRASMRRFNRTHPMPAQVPLYSVAGYSDLFFAPRRCARGAWPAPTQLDLPQPLFLIFGNVLAGSDPQRPISNDGVVTTESAVFGTFLGCVPADHMEQLGWLPSPLPNLLSGYDRNALFDRLIDNLESWEESNLESATTKMASSAGER